MVDLDCERLHEVAAELSLGVLPGRDRAEALAHVQECPAGEAHLRELTGIGDRLIGLAPAVEPPVGFEQRVLERFGLTSTKRRPRRRRPMVLAAAVLVLAAAGALGWLGHSVLNRPNPESVLKTAEIESGGHWIGEAYAHTDTRSWLYVEVSSLPANGTVSCQLRLRDGRVINVGAFPVTGGAAQWGGPAPMTGTGPAEVRILAADGTVIGTARFG
jgi:hypothetical protein